MPVQDLRRSNFTSADVRYEHPGQQCTACCTAHSLRGAWVGKRQHQLLTFLCRLDEMRVTIHVCLGMHCGSPHDSAEAGCRGSDFHNSKLNGAYFIKAVAYKTNFENADISDVLFDRAVLNDSNLRNAILQRTVFTRSDLGGADIYGADFTNALVDRAQQLKLCRFVFAARLLRQNI